MLTNKKVKDLIRDGYEHLSVDKKELSDMLVEMAKGDEWYLAGTASAEKRRSFSGMLIPALALVCLLLVFGIGTYRNNYKTTATVYLDVNPSIAVSINKDEKVLDVRALNEDAEKILAGMDFKGSSLKVTVNALIGSLVRNGYIDELSNSILVSVSDKDGNSAEELEKELLTEISSLLDNASILSQRVDTDDSIGALAEKYGISPGKAKLVRELADSSGTYTYEELAGLTIHELNLLNKRGESSSAQRNGEPSDRAYIGIKGAIDAALQHAGVEENRAYIDEAELEYDGSRMVYEVEFRAEDCEYDYTIDAVSGEVLSFEKKKSVTDSYIIAEPSVDGILPEEKIKQSVLQHAGLSDGQVTGFKTELEYEDSILKYEIEFVSGDQEYDYEVDALTGQILKSETETADHDD